MDFLEKVASPRPHPAGGAAAAYTVGLAFGLLWKVVYFESRRHPENSVPETNFIAAQQEIGQLLEDAQRLVMEDSDIYQQFINSRRSADQSAMKECFKNLMGVSMHVIEKAGNGLEWVSKLQPVVARPMMPHLKVACELIMGATNATMQVIASNMQAIRNDEKRHNYQKKLDDIRRDFNAKYSNLLIE